jgi:hypothetical protein
MPPRVILRRLTAPRSVHRRLIRTLVLSLTVALIPASAALASSGLKCANSNQYGSSCIDITGKGLKLQDIQGYFTPPNNDYLSHRSWAIELTSYGCDPRGKTKSQCAPRARWFTRLRHGNPPQQGSNCAVLEPNGVGFQQCVNYGEAYADAAFRDWRTFYKLPHRFTYDHWFCTEEAVRVHRRWHSNGAPGTPGVRGCAEVRG